MSRRLQVLVEDDEFDQIHAAARSEGMTMSEWVRRTLRRARSSRADTDVAQRLAVLRNATAHAFPTADIEEMLEQTERGYLDG